MFGKVLGSLWVLILLFAPGCSKLENGVDAGQLECGEDLGSSKVVKALQPNGSEFSDLAVSSAAIIDSTGARLPLRTTSKSCVILPEQKKQGSFILIQVNESQSQYFYFGPADPAESGRSFLLRNVVQPRFEWSCPLAAGTSARSLTLASEIDSSALSPYVLRYTITQGDRPISEKWLIQPQAIEVDLKKNGAVFPDGPYQIKMDLFDVNQNQNWEKAARTRSCEIIVDNEAPSGIQPNFGSSTFGLLDQTFFEVEPGRTVYFPNADGFVGDIFYCLVGLADDGTDVSDSCENPEGFSRLASNVFLPTSGLWRFVYFAQDQAGNRSGLESRRVAIVDGKNIANLLLRVKTSILLLANSPFDALDLAMQNFFEFTGLKTLVEKARVRRDIADSILATALQSVPRRRSLDATESVVDFKVDEQSGDVFYLNGDGYLKRLDAEKLQLVSESRIEGNSPLIVPKMKRIYVFDDATLTIQDLKGKVINSLDLGRSMAFKNYQVLGDSSAIMFSNGVDIIILSDQDRLLLNKLVPEALQDIYLLKGVSYQTLTRDSQGRIVVDKGENQQIVIDASTCFPEDNLASLSVKFTPKGNYVQAQSMGRFALFNLKGEQIHCSFDDIGWIDEDENFAVVLDYVDERNNDGRKFYLTLYEFLKGEGASEKLESVYYSDLSEGSIKRIEFLTKEFFVMEYYSGLVKIVDFDGNTVSQVSKLDLHSERLQYDRVRRRIMGTVGTDLMEWRPFEQPVQRFIKSWPARPKRNEYRFKFVGSSALVKNEDKIYFAQNMDAPWSFLKESKLELRQAESNSVSGRIAYSLGDWSGETLEILDKKGNEPVFSMTFEQAEILRLKWVSSSGDLLIFDDSNKLHVVSESLFSYESTELDFCQGSITQDIGFDRSGNILAVSCQNGVLKIFKNDGSGWLSVAANELKSYAVAIKVSPQGDGVFFTDELSKVGPVKYWNFRGPIRNLSDDYNFDFELVSVAASGTSILGLTSSGICQAKTTKTTAECLAPPGSYVGGFQYIEEQGILVVHRDERLLDLYSDAGNLIATIKPPRLDNPRRTSYILDFAWFEEKLYVAGLAGIFAYEIEPEKIVAKHCQMSGLDFESACKTAGFSSPNR
ncbi:MAG TPA: hypothetical protein VFO10_12060 [Oligoflexus sp.]|uniref:hypothetical protein n=1 Tax=Oligoflexus sp. TaxID=1971216 RepID=UPI002D7F3A12|nr:hypothetical protein [Oligoflexus sp.]HET9237983.1 hypothetical protein [Oligoflexus sp.]